ncbi:MAG: 4-hydroxy-tetrahydrodipicolinate synthase [Boseongicola sp. SB0675_bin_26]|nr:4-hydroxy-tetrahydrodipicolinate synthase [Boseongicola sp. SB0675_bin_26]
MVAMVTPFCADGAIDFGAVKTLIEYHQEGGTRSLFFMGVAGEGSVLSDLEHETIIRRTRAMQPPGMNFVYGCTGNSTEGTIAKVAVAAAYDADAAVITLPPNVGPDQEQAIGYFRDVSDRATIPLGVFNNPARLLTDLDANSALRILSDPRYVLHKEGTPRTGQIGLILKEDPPVTFLADDSPEQDILVTSMALGARGIANATGNLIPSEFAQLAKPWGVDTDLSAFRAAYFRILPIMHFLYGFRSPIAIKGVMNALGLPAGEPRRPLMPLSDFEVEEGVQLLLESGLCPGP